MEEADRRQRKSPRGGGEGEQGDGGDDAGDDEQAVCARVERARTDVARELKGCDHGCGW
jgi:hypothetical protein